MNMLTASTSTVAATAFAWGLVAGPAQAAIYSETFAPGVPSSISTFGWSAYRSTGTNYSASTVDPFLVNATNIFSSSGTILNTDIAMISDAGTIDPDDYESDLAISFSQSATDQGTLGNISWRVFVQVGSTLYASNPITPTALQETKSVVVSNNVWRVWTGETNLSDGFVIGNISGTADVLPAGSISSIGLLLDDGTDNNDRERVFSFSITGTPVPEPGSVAVVGLGGLSLLTRRRR